MTGCAGFFIPNSTTTTVATSTSGDYIYMVNQSTNTLSEFSVGSSVLTAISGSPISLASSIQSGTASSVAVTRQNTFVYVGGQGGIACYSIGTGGALTAATAGNFSTTGKVVSLTTSPDGQWLLWLDGVLGTVNVYNINSSTGALTASTVSGVVPATAYPGAINSNVSAARAIAIAPNGLFVAVALGNGGDVIYPFTTSNGVLGSGQLIAFSTTGNTTVSDNAITFDTASAYVYIARGVNGSGLSLIASYSIGSNAVPTAIATATTGDIPYAILVDSLGDYVYTANRGSNDISGFSIASGKFTATSASPYTAGTTATALVEDNTKTYLISGNYGGSSDFTLFAFDAIAAAAGKLDAISVGASGTDPAGAIAVAATHYSGSPF